MTLAAVSLSALYRLMADLMSGCYAVTHDYALAIALLTLATVAVTTPLTWKSSRGMIAMQALAPEMKKLQAKYKSDRVALNEEMSKLYREAGVNPLSGCLPMVPQMVVFYVLYHTILNLSHKATYKTLAAAQKACPTPSGKAAQITAAGGKYSCSAPTNLGTHTLLYQNLVAAGGHMKVFGFDLTLGVRTAHGGALVGCFILVALVVGAQYWMTRQVNRRNPAAAANPQAQMMQRIFPLFFGFISISIQAGVNVYFLVSTLCRILQQTLMFRYDPVLRRQLLVARGAKPDDLPPARTRGGAAGGRGPAGGGGRRPGGSGAGDGDDALGADTEPRPTRGGGLARLLGLADAAQPAPRSGNLDRFIGPGQNKGPAGRNGAGGTKGNNGAGGAKGNTGGSTNNRPDGRSSNGAGGNGSGPRGDRSAGGRNAGAGQERYRDPNRSRSKRQRRSR